MKILIVDDHPLMRVGIAAIIDAQTDMMTVAQAGTGEEALRLWSQHPPDVVLVDLKLPGMSGVDVIRAIRSQQQNAKFVVLTTYDGDEDIHQALGDTSSKECPMTRCLMRCDVCRRATVTCRVPWKKF